jgi:hypothetical protein
VCVCGGGVDNGRTHAMPHATEWTTRSEYWLVHQQVYQSCIKFVLLSAGLPVLFGCQHEAVLAEAVSAPIELPLLLLLQS